MREPFQICSTIRTTYIWDIWISEFFRLFYIISTQTIYVNQKLHILRRFATLRAISNLFKFIVFLNTLCIIVCTCQAEKIKLMCILLSFWMIYKILSI